MRHKSATQHLGRSPNGRKALVRSLVNSLVENGRITTTLARAKELKRHVERAVTMARKNTVHARRVLLSRFPNPKVVETLFKDIAPRFQNRPGGYTRVIKLGVRKGDCAEMAIIEFVDFQVSSADTTQNKKPKKKAVKEQKEAKKA